MTSTTVQPLAGKIALVTGSSRAIGAAVAKRLALDGASVVVHYCSNAAQGQNVVESIREAGGSAALLQADLGQLHGPAQLLAALPSAFDSRFANRLDILVNNAGTFEYAPLQQATDESFDRLFNLNVRSVFQLSRHAAGLMMAAGWGRIINMGSVFGEAAPAPGMSLYCGTKFAIQGFTRAWSRDLGPHGITVNNIQPAVIQPEPAPICGPTFEAMKRHTSVGRFGKASEIADMAAFLVSPQAAFINGESFNVDGGWNA